MRLITKELERSIPPLYGQDGMGDDAIVYAKLFHPLSSYTLYVLEYDPVERLIFGWGGSPEPEYGYASLDELETVRVMGLGIEQDVHWRSVPLREVRR
ncbi:MAG: DUF2958 domain-containing protein [Chloroflexota bacterium]|nr:DUF2958 domain-containing protein [Chloroflexota bacterium]